VKAYLRAESPLSQLIPSPPAVCPNLRTFTASRFPCRGGCALANYALTDNYNFSRLFSGADFARSRAIDSPNPPLRIAHQIYMQTIPSRA